MTTATPIKAAASVWAMTGAICVAAPATASADWIPGAYMAQALDRLCAGVESATMVSTYALDDERPSLYGALLDVGDSATLTQTFRAGERYLVIAAGDHDIIDLDLAVYEQASGRVIDIDRLTDANPVIEFSPTVTGAYTIQMTVFDGHTAGFASLAIMRDGAPAAPVSDVRATLADLLSYASRAASAAGGGALHWGGGEWALFAGYARPGETLWLEGVSLEPGPHAIVAVADGSARDIDLRLRNDERELAADRGRDARPSIFWSSRFWDAYRVELENYAGSGSSFVAVATVDLGE